MTLQKGFAKTLVEVLKKTIRKGIMKKPQWPDLRAKRNQKPTKGHLKKGPCRFKKRSPKDIAA